MGTYSDIFKPNMGIGLDFSYNINSFPVVLRCSSTYDNIPLDNDLDLTLLSFGLMIATSFYDTPLIEISPYLGGGYFYSFLQDNSDYEGGHPFGTAGVRCEYLLTDLFGFGIDIGYRHFFGFSDDISLTLSFRSKIFFPVGEENDLNSSIQCINEIYPVLYDYYQNNPSGSVSLSNISDKSIIISKVTFFIQDYMEEPENVLLDTILPGKESLAVDLYVRLLPSVLTITRSVTSLGRVTIEYISRGKIKNRKHVQSLTFQPVNLIQKSDPRQISAFFTHNDHFLETFSESIKTSVTEYTSAEIDTNIFIAMSTYNALKLAGIEFLDSPSLTDGYRVIQFPYTTLSRKKGNSVDIAVLLCSLFIFLDMDAALIVTDDAVFTAFSINLKPDSLNSHYKNANNFIISHNKVWIPFVYTTKTRSFYEAVEDGIRLWTENSEGNSSVLYPVSELRKTYNGLDMSLIDDDITIDAVQGTLLRNQNKMDVNKFFTRQNPLEPFPAEQNAVNEQQNIRFLNNLSIIYAKFTMYDKAIVLLHTILLKQDYIPALVNLGNIYYLLREMKKASVFYERGYEKDPLDPVILLGLARVNYVLENYGNVKEYYRKLVSIEPELAGEFKYLDLSGVKTSPYPENPDSIIKVIWIEK